MTKPDFITIDAEQDENDLVSRYETLTNKELYPAQNERILISLIAYYGNLVKTQFNESASLNITQFSRAPFVDYLGAMFGCTRLKEDYGTDTISVELYEAFTSDTIIEKGLEIQSKDGKYIFKTIEDVTISAGTLTGEVGIICETAGSEPNQYGIGDINTLIKPFSYIKSVANTKGVSGGLDAESNDSYIERILLAPESFTCAGSHGAYIYHTKSSHQNIVDAEAESPQIPASITTDETVVTETDGVITGTDFSANVDYKTGTINFTYNNRTFKIVLPPAATVNVYPLTNDGILTSEIKTAVENKLTEDDVMPMTDYIQVIAPTAVNKTINITVTIATSADYDSTVDLVDSSINDFCKNIKKELGSELVPSQLNTQIGKIEGVYDVDLDGLELIKNKVNEYFVLTPNITYKRH